MTESEQHNPDKLSPQSLMRRIPSSRLTFAANLLSFIRLAGAGALLVIAYADLPAVFLTLYFVLLATDWVDGKLAVLSGRSSTLGARLDSVADIALFLALLAGVCWLRPEVVEQLAWWITAAIGSYAAPLSLMLIRFRRLPGFHAWSAKFSWYLLNIGLAVMLLAGPLWPLKVSMVSVSLANLEAAAIAVTIPEDESNVKSLVHVLGRRRRQNRRIDDDTAA